MKNILILVVTFLISITTFAQQGINYKALIKDDLGNTLTNQSIGVQFQIREATANGTTVYTETHTQSTDANGILILNIGTGTTSDTFSTINWSSNEHWLNLQIDITGGTNYIDMSTTQFMAVPYALSSADNLWQRNGDDTIAITERIGVGVSEPDSALHIKNHDDEGGIVVQSNTGNNSSILLTNVYPSTNIKGAHNQISSDFGNLTFSRYQNGELYLNLTQLLLKSNGDVIAPNSPDYPSNYQSLITRNSGDNRYLKKDGNNVYDNIGIGVLEPEGLLHIKSQNDENVLIVQSTSGQSDIVLRDGDQYYTDNRISSNNGNLTISKFESDTPSSYLTLLEISQYGNIIAPNANNPGPNSLITKNYADYTYLNSSSNLIPIAYGSVNGSANPVIVGGTGNFSVTRNSTTNEYTISVTDQSLDLTNTVASVISNTSNFRTVNVTYSGGNMIVHIFIANGTKVASPFQFTIYKL